MQMFYLIWQNTTCKFSILFDKTQHARFQGMPLFEATKQQNGVK